MSTRTATPSSFSERIRAAVDRPLDQQSCVRVLSPTPRHQPLIFPSDRYRSYAHQQAWYQQDGESTNFNPWGKRKAPLSTLTDHDEENASRTRTNQSDNQVQSSVELGRRSQNQNDFPAPPHSSSMPVQSRKAQFPPQNGHLDDPAETEKSADSGTATSNTIIPEDEPVILPAQSEEEGPRKRKFGGILGKFHRKGRQDKELERTATGRSKPLKQKFTFVGQLKATLLCSPINVLLVMVPVGIGVHFSNVSPIGVFVINFIAIIPLAAMLSYATEELALRTGETFGGLLNATFGLVSTLSDESTCLADI